MASVGLLIGDEAGKVAVVQATDSCAQDSSLGIFQKNFCHPVPALVNLTDCILALLSSFCFLNSTKFKRKMKGSEG